MRTDITFVSEGTRCAAWLYQPDTVGPSPCVVMARGFTVFVPPLWDEVVAAETEFLVRHLRPVAADAERRV